MESPNLITTNWLCWVISFYVPKKQQSKQMNLDIALKEKLHSLPSIPHCIFWDMTMKPVKKMTASCDKNKPTSSTNWDFPYKRRIIT